jgi:hypothetical protein
LPISPLRRACLPPRFASCIACLLLLSCGIVAAQEASAPQPAPAVSQVKRVEGVDATSGIHYLRLSVTASPASGAAQDPPRLTMECRDKNGKHELLWYLSFGGISEQGFEPPFHATDTELFPPHLPRQKLTMFFEGYMQSKPFVRTWLVEFSGELRYCNPGIDCPNMEGPQYFLTFLNALPGLRIRGANPSSGSQQELVFQTRPLLDNLKASPACAF